jgi:L,D-transpeptidase ErfK/SrfK
MHLFSAVPRLLHAPFAGIAALMMSMVPPGAPAAEYAVRGDLAGAVRHHVVRPEDTLLDIAQQEEVGFVELRAANPDIDPWAPGDGAPVTLPTAFILPAAARDGIVINLPEQRLYFFRDGPTTVVTYPVGIPTDIAMIPLGRTIVARKRTNPTWFPPPSLRKSRPELPTSVPPGPDNPLGRFAISLAWPNFVIHGTNKPDGVGRRVSNGCIRLYPKNIETLYGAVKIGTPVSVVDQPVKVGWSDGALYLEVHPTQSEADRVESHGRLADPVPLYTDGLILAVAGHRADRVDWEQVGRAVRERRGIPVRITREVPMASASRRTD